MKTDRWQADHDKDWKELAMQYRDEIIRLEGEVEVMAAEIDGLLDKISHLECEVTELLEDLDGDGE